MQPTIGSAVGPEGYEGVPQGDLLKKLNQMKVDAGGSRLTPDAAFVLGPPPTGPRIATVLAGAPKGALALPYWQLLKQLKPEAIAEKAIPLFQQFGLPASLQKLMTEQVVSAQELSVSGLQREKFTTANRCLLSLFLPAAPFMLFKFAKHPLVQHNRLDAFAEQDRKIKAELRAVISKLVTKNLGVIEQVLAALPQDIGEKREQAVLDQVAALKRVGTLEALVQASLLEAYLDQRLDSVIDSAGVNHTYLTKLKSGAGSLASKALSFLNTDVGKLKMKFTDLKAESVEYNELLDRAVEAASTEIIGRISSVAHASKLLCIRALAKPGGSLKEMLMDTLVAWRRKIHDRLAPLVNHSSWQAIDKTITNHVQQGIKVVKSKVLTGGDPQVAAKELADIVAKATAEVSGGLGAFLADATGMMSNFKLVHAAGGIAKATGTAVTGALDKIKTELTNTPRVASVIGKFLAEIGPAITNGKKA